MIITFMEIKLYVPFAHSLKEKRMVVKSIIAKLRNTFNISIMETDCQDIHQTIVLGLVFIAASTAMADSVSSNLISFIESNTEAEVTEINRDIR
jgi:uncharacterized protein YlxP (DUF503 family)